MNDRDPLIGVAIPAKGETGEHPRQLDVYTQQTNQEYAEQTTATRPGNEAAQAKKRSQQQRERGGNGLDRPGVNVETSRGESA